MRPCSFITGGPGASCSFAVTSFDCGFAKAIVIADADHDYGCFQAG